MKTAFFFVLIFLNLTEHTSAYAQAYLEQITGEISTFGNPETRDTLIAEAESTKPLSLCSGDNKFLLTQLAGSVCTLYGNLKTHKKSTEKCFDVDHFKIDEISRGRKAYVGELKEESKNKFVIISSDQNRWVLAAAAPGIAELKNSLVVADLVASTSNNGEQTWLVARMFAHPTP